LNAGGPIRAAAFPRAPAPAGRLRFAAVLLAALAVLAQTPARAGDVAQAPTAPMHPMARDMLDRLLLTARNTADPEARRRALEDAAASIPRAFYGLILDGVPAPGAGTPQWDVAHAVFLRWAWETPDFAAAWAADSQRGPFRSEALAEAAGRWAAKDPDGARRWACALPEADRSWVAENAGPFMGRTAPEAVEAWKRSVEPAK
jgi:hypothetical protein